MDNCGDEKLVEAIAAAAQEVDGKMRLACADAFRVAADLEVSLGAIGQVCNQRDIKIARCQLGCFS